MNFENFVGAALALMLVVLTAFFFAMGMEAQRNKIKDDAVNYGRAKVDDVMLVPAPTK